MAAIQLDPVGFLRPVRDSAMNVTQRRRRCKSYSRRTPLHCTSEPSSPSPRPTPSPMSPSVAAASLGTICIPSGRGSPQPVGLVDPQFSDQSQRASGLCNGLFYVVPAALRELKEQTPVGMGMFRVLS